jgi:arabinose-5-phosphate isomerase
LNLQNLQNIAKKTLELEAKGICDAALRIDEEFALCVLQILESKGRVVVTGIGKSANIATKIVATLSSTGTPSLFMHAADAIHGDLGMIQSQDCVVCISNSGNTPEIKVLVPLLKQVGSKLIAIVGNRNSFLAKQADFVLDATIECEAEHLAMRLRFVSLLQEILTVKILQNYILVVL